MFKSTSIYKFIIPSLYIYIYIILYTRSMVYIGMDLSSERANPPSSRRPVFLRDFIIISFSGTSHVGPLLSSDLFCRQRAFHCYYSAHALFRSPAAAGNININNTPILYLYNVMYVVCTARCGVLGRWI